MNFIKKYFLKSPKNIKVILTLQICEPSLKITEFDNFKIINCHEVLEKYNYDLLKDSNQKRIEYLSEEIINSETNILICDTGLSITDFHKISEILKSSELNIDKILVPNESKRIRKLQEGQEMYRNHSRWIDFYPGQIEDIHNEFELTIKNLKSRYENTKTEILEI
jgi:hypothetical protein